MPMRAIFIMHFPACIAPIAALNIRRIRYVVYDVYGDTTMSFDYFKIARDLWYVLRAVRLSVC